MSWPADLGSTMGRAVPRGVALSLGLFALLNVVGELRAPGFDANLWWIHLPSPLSYCDHLLLTWSAACLLWFAWQHNLSPLGRNVVGLTCGLLAAASLGNVLTFYSLLSRGEIHSQFPVPFSMCVIAALAVIGAGLWWTTERDGRRGRAGYYCMLIAVVGVCGLCFPVAQMICFGSTDYRRRADVAVVLGAKVYADGRLSLVVEERVRTGCQLYAEGLVGHILFSGGPGVGAVHETDAMRRRALELGVPAAAILLDPDGWDTDRTAENTLRLCRRHGWKRILAVSQFFHLPRIKLAFHRHGSEVYTVPSVQLNRLRYLPYFMAREVAAWWVYYLRPLW